MRAAVFDRFGEPADVLSVRETEAPTPAAGEVRVRMLASPINPSDLMTIRGVYGVKPNLPATPGFEGVGVVESSGGGLLGKFLVGKRVAAMHTLPGAWREQTVILAKQAVPIPNSLTDEQAAGFFINPVTAYAMTRKVLAVKPGEWLLQTAAGSAVGRMVIRLGKRYGFRTINVVRRPELVDELKSLGADAVLTAEGDELVAQVAALTQNRGVAYAIDPVGGAVGGAVFRCLGGNGRMLVYGSLADEPTAFSPRLMLTSGASIAPFWLGRYMRSLGLASKLLLIRSVSKLVSAGVLAAPVGETYPLDRIADAVRAAEAPGKSGKVLVKIAER